MLDYFMEYDKLTVVNVMVLGCRRVLVMLEGRGTWIEIKEETKWITMDKKAKRLIGKSFLQSKEIVQKW